MRIGIDVGGTKIEIVALGKGGTELLRERVPTPQGAYDETVEAIARLVHSAEAKLGRKCTVGLAIPGTISPITGLVKNANSTRLIGHRLDRDISRAIGREVRIANDANCFTLSEASDGAAAGLGVVFGIIAGTGVGGGVCVSGQVIAGSHLIAGEWGHNPLPSPTPDEVRAAPRCYCGKLGCIEAWCSGPALERQFVELTGTKANGTAIAAAAGNGDAIAASLMDRFYDRFARSIATIVNVIDPDAIVFGGGLSNIDALYIELPPRIVGYAFTAESETRVLKNRHGDSSGVRGAAWLWREDETAGPAG
jgi:fructokinase